MSAEADAVLIGGRPFHRLPRTAAVLRDLGRFELRRARQIKLGQQAEASSSTRELARLLLRDEHGNAPTTELLREHSEDTAGFVAASLAEVHAARARMNAAVRQLALRADDELRHLKPCQIGRVRLSDLATLRHRTRGRGCAGSRPRHRRVASRSAGGGSSGDPHLSGDDPPGEPARLTVRVAA
jgi:hypothetical protein